MIEQIRARIQAGQFEFSKHAVDQSVLRRNRSGIAARISTDK
ncbi:MAG: hypothetical protein AB1797_01030 [bacterium]